YGPERITLSLATGVLFFWWGQRFLLGGQVRWWHLLPGALATMAGLIGLRGFSYFVFTPLLVDNAISSGTVGGVVMVASWLIGVGFVIFGGALFGRWLLDHHGHRFTDGAAGCWTTTGTGSPTTCPRRPGRSRPATTADPCPPPAVPAAHTADVPAGAV